MAVQNAWRDRRAEMRERSEALHRFIDNWSAEASSFPSTFGHFDAERGHPVVPVDLWPSLHRELIRQGYRQVD